MREQAARAIRDTTFCEGEEALDNRTGDGASAFPPNYYALAPLPDLVPFQQSSRNRAVSFRAPYLAAALQLTFRRSRMRVLEFLLRPSAQVRARCSPLYAEWTPLARQGLVEPPLLDAAHFLRPVSCHFIHESLRARVRSINAKRAITLLSD